LAGEMEPVAEVRYYSDVGYGQANENCQKVRNSFRLLGNKGDFTAFRSPHGDMPQIPNWDTKFEKRELNYFLFFFKNGDGGKNIIDMIMLRLMLSTIFKMMVLEQMDFLETVNNNRRAIDLTVFTFPFAVDPNGNEVIRFENLFEHRNACTNKTRSIYEWMGIHKKASFIGSIADLKAGIRSKRKKAIAFTNLMLDLALKSFNVHVIDNCIFKNCPRQLTEEIHSACRCFQESDDPLVAEYDGMADHVAEISTSGDSRKAYLNDMEIWKCTKQMLYEGVVSTNIANRIWLERSRYVDKKIEYLLKNPDSKRTKQQAVDEFESYLKQMEAN